MYGKGVAFNRKTHLAACKRETIDAARLMLVFRSRVLGKDGKHHFSTTLEEHNAFLNSGEYGG